MSSIRNTPQKNEVDFADDLKEFEAYLASQTENELLKEEERKPKIAIEAEAAAKKKKIDEALELIEVALDIFKKQLSDLEKDILKKYREYCEKCENKNKSRNKVKEIFMISATTLAQADITCDKGVYKALDNLKKTLEETKKTLDKSKEILEKPITSSKETKKSFQLSDEIQKIHTQLEAVSQSDELKNYSQRHEGFFEKIIDRFFRWLYNQEEPKKSVKTIKTKFHLFSVKTQNSTPHVSEENKPTPNVRTI